jgi:hypothetical protein
VHVTLLKILNTTYGGEKLGMSFFSPCQPQEEKRDAKGFTFGVVREVSAAPPAGS